MCGIIETQLEWKYSPKNFFDEPVHIPFQGVNIELNDGVVKAVVPAEIYINNIKIRDELTQIIESRFLAVQITKHCSFELGKASRIDIKENGKRVIYCEIESAKFIITGSPVDFIHKDKFGNVISDTKRDRIQKQEWFAKKVAFHRPTDKTLDQMLKSYQMSVNDQENEFVHLYEVRDALLQKFSNKNNAIKKLNITKPEWDKIGTLANILPIKQARHRGKFAGSLRNASITELDTARKSVVNLINKYLEFLK